MKTYHPAIAVAFASAAISTSMLTGCAKGGGFNGDTAPYTPPPTVTETAEGQWSGTTADDRAIAGVVTHPDATTQVSQFFLAYSAAGNHAVWKGFIAGGGASTATTSTDGDFSSGSAENALREFNFEGTGPAHGSLTATYSGRTRFDGSFTSTPLTASWTFSGQQISFYKPATVPLDSISFTPASLPFTDGGTAWTIDTATPAFSGNIVFEPYVEHLVMGGTPFDVTFAARTLTFGLNTGGQPSSLTYDANTRTMQWAGYFTETSSFTCPSTPAIVATVCNVLVSSATAGTVALTFDDASLTTYTGTITWLTGPNPTVGNAPLATMTFTGSVPSTPSVTHTYTSTYNTAYEDTPSLATIQGNYSGSAGIDVQMDDSSTFDIAADGSVTGADTIANCTYTGTVTPRTDGNVYDVTLAFSGASCAYDGETVNGAATYSAGQVTVTAVNAARDKGFLFVGAQP